MLDAYDLKILAEVQKDARIAQSELGERVHLSTAAVNRRLKRLTDEGVIDKVAAVVAPEALGYALTIVAEVEAESVQVDLLDAMKQSFSASPMVQQCYYVTGQCDFILVIVAQSMEQYQELTRELFFQNNNVKRFRTFVSMHRVKVSLGVPIDLTRLTAPDQGA